MVREEKSLGFLREAVMPDGVRNGAWTKGGCNYEV